MSVRVRIEALGDENLQRASQLLNKTNQMNLRTRRLPEPDLMDWARSDGRSSWTVRVRDCFGDSGISGIISLESLGNLGKTVAGGVAHLFSVYVRYACVVFRWGSRSCALPVVKTKRTRF